MIGFSGSGIVLGFGLGLLLGGLAGFHIANTSFPLGRSIQPGLNSIAAVGYCGRLPDAHLDTGYKSMAAARK
jgi:hypothetical protein